ncbi:MAG: hypothetical protein ACRDHY_13130 [Anaerolineales bacterium]
MMTHRAFARIAPVGAAAVVLVFALAACAPAAAPASGRVHRAGLVVVHGTGEIRRACVEFTEETISGEELLARSGFEVARDEANPLGSLICAIDGEGCDGPGEPCLCQCLGPGSCAYWSYFQRAPQAGWTYSALGARARRVWPGELDGWVWLTSSSPADAEAAAGALDEFGFEDVCHGP